MGGIFSVTQLIKDPVPTVADLPSSEVKVGAIRIVLDGFSVYVWDGAAWRASTAPPPVPVLDNTTIYYDPSGRVAIKPQGITDNLLSNSSTLVYEWSSTIPYVAGDVVIYYSALWICRFANTNVAPAIISTNWRQIANVDSPQNLVYAPTVTTNYNFPSGNTGAIIDTTSGDIVVTMPSIAALTNTDTFAKMQMFRLLKKSQSGKMTITLAAGNTFLDGSPTWVITAQGMYVMYAIFQSTNWSKG